MNNVLAVPAHESPRAFRVRRRNEKQASLVPKELLNSGGKYEIHSILPKSGGNYEIPTILLKSRSNYKIPNMLLPSHAIVEPDDNLINFVLSATGKVL